MLAKHIIGYIPSLAVPALTSFAAIYCYTRLLSVEEYGYYALATNVMALLNAVFFYWLQVSVPRLMPQAIKERRAQMLRATAYVTFAAVSVALALGAAIFIKLAGLGKFTTIAWLAVLLALARSLLTLNQAFYRSELNFRRYNVLECGQAMLGLALGLLFVYVYGWGSAGALMGLVSGMAVMALLDVQMLTQAPPRCFSRTALAELVRFGLPLVAIFGFSFITSTSDRFLIEHFRGVAEVGIYAAGYSLMDRIGQIVFMLVATPSFPLVIHKFEQEGIEAAREQTYRNGVVMLALGMPACAGLILCNAQLAAVLIGPEFRAGAKHVMPWIAASTFIGGLAAHYFDHAFHLAKKPYLLLYTQGPAALCNLALNLLLIPRCGYMGAAYSTAVSYLLLLGLSASLGRRAFRVRFPFKPALQITGATLCMALVLQLIQFPANFFGLAAMIVLGGGIYTAMLWLCDVADGRDKARRAFAFYFR